MTELINVHYKNDMKNLKEVQAVADLSEALDKCLLDDDLDVVCVVVFFFCFVETFYHLLILFVRGVQGSHTLMADTLDHLGYKMERDFFDTNEGGSLLRKEEVMAEKKALESAKEWINSLQG